MRRAWVGLLCAAATLACSRDRRFPDGFNFGTAVAGFQVEMGCPTLPADRCEDRNSDWYRFITSTITIGKASNHLSGEPPSAGPGYYELWEQDLDRVSALGLGGFRFSFEWSRIFPASTAGIEGFDALKARASTAALDYYHRQLAGLRQRGIKPLVTINHYTLPSWILDAEGCNAHWVSCSPRGWADPATVTEIAKYAGFVAREFGAEVDLWATLNEPLAVVIFGMIQPSDQRSNPPSVLLQLADAKKAALNLIQAHARMYDAIHQNDTADADGDGKAAEVGVVFPALPVLPANPDSALDQHAAKNISYVYNDLFLNAVLLGKLDPEIDGSSTEQADLVGRSDYLGLNYYFGLIVEGDTQSALPQFSPLLTFNPFTAKPTPTRPRGIYDMLLMIKDKYPGVPVIVTENGATEDIEGGQEKFLAQHLQWVLRAIDAGVAVRGYYWWSLMDNYEWNHGMSMRFGLYAVDPKDRTKARTARPVADTLSRIARERKLSAELIDRYPIEALP